MLIILRLYVKISLMLMLMLMLTDDTSRPLCGILRGTAFVFADCGSAARFFPFGQETPRDASVRIPCQGTGCLAGDNRKLVVRRY
jgi:hypothetical protein